MTTKLDGTKGIVFPDTTEQSSKGITQLEADAAFLTEAEADALFLTPAEGDARFVNLSGDTMTGGLTAIGLSVRSPTNYHRLDLGGLGFLDADSNASQVLLKRGANNESIYLASGNIGLSAGSYLNVGVNVNGFTFGGLQTTAGSSGTAAFEWTGSNHVLRVFTSSRRFKQDIQDSPYGLAAIQKLRSVTFRGIQEHDSKNTMIGLIAEEVADAGLDILVQRNDDEVSGVHYSQIISILVKAVQELTARVAELEAR